MPVEYNEAVDEVYGIINSVWPTVAALVGYTPEVRWQGKQEPEKPPVDKIWARVSSQIVTDSQRSLANHEGKRRYEAHALLYCQVFCPRSVPGQLDLARQVAMMLRAEFRKPSPSGSIWFRNQAIYEFPPTADGYQLKVTSEFVYDTIQ